MDGGGGEAGVEVENVAHQWIWKHGRKVALFINSGLLFSVKWSNIISESDCGRTKQRPCKKLEGGLETTGVDILHIVGFRLVQVMIINQERQLAVIFEDDAEVSPQW